MQEPTQSGVTTDEAPIALDAPMLNNKEKSRLVTSTLLGTTIEFFDVYIFGIAAGLYFGSIFFTGTDPIVGIIASFGTLAMGFLIRPVGGIIGGHFGDKYGRKKVLIVSMILMGTSTFAVGLLPGYDTIGVWAPILLVALRLCQGLGAGAEWGGGVLMLVEHMSRKRRGFFGSVAQAGIWLGIAIGTVVFAGITTLPEDVQMWAWRVPFLASALLVLVALWIRVGVRESPEFEKAKTIEKVKKERVKVPIMELLHSHKKVTVLAVLLALGTCSFQMYSTFGTAYAKELDLNISMILTFQFINALFAIVMTLFFGWLSDIVGRRILAILGSIIIVPSMFYFFWAMNNAEMGQILIALLILEVGHSMTYGPLGAYLAELFVTKARYTGVSVAYQIGGGAIAGLVPLLSAVVLGASGGAPNIWWVPSIMVFVSIVTIIGALIAPDRHGQPLSVVDKEYAAKQHALAGDAQP